MQILKTRVELSDFLKNIQRQEQSLALVPTMGNLHAGHIALTQCAKQYAQHVIVSIFVNPLQFGPSEDFNLYPRTLEQDCAHLQSESIAAVFAPSISEMYPDGIPLHTVIDVPELANQLCGQSRPGHFQGVCSVVAKLFHLIPAQFAIFGEKDYQQLSIILRMVRDLMFPIQIIAAPIVRDVDGLALSSRNQYLSTEERAIAPKLQQTLQKVAHSIQNGARNFSQLESLAIEELNRLGFIPDYISIRAENTLQPAGTSERLIILAAAKLGRTRLIDNLKV